MAGDAAQIVFSSGWSRRTPHLELNERQFEPWQRNAFFRALSPHSMRDFESIMSIENYDAGDSLFVEQEPLTRVFIVISGDVRLSVQDLCGRRITFQIARHGAVLGVDSVLYGSRSGWSADMLHSSRIGVIGREQFLRFAERNPQIYRVASVQLIQILGCACATLRIVGLNTCIRRRLALQLLEWGERGSKNGDQTQFRMALTHEQIAEFVGSVRETVTRALIALKELRLVEIRGSMVRIPSTTALRNYAISS